MSLICPNCGDYMEPLLDGPDETGIYFCDTCDIECDTATIDDDID